MKKKFPLYVLEFALQLQHWTKFDQKISIKVLRKVQMSCALELKPHSNIDDDLGKKFGCLDTPNLQTGITPKTLGYECCSGALGIQTSKFFFTDHHQCWNEA